MARYQITGPDGASYEITAPDNASQADVLAYAQKHHVTQGSPPPAEASRAATGGSAPSALLGGMLNGATFNMADPAYAAILATVGAKQNLTSPSPDWSDRYHQNLAALRARDEASAKQHPVASLVGEVAGGLMLPVGRVASVADAMRLGGKVGLGYGIGTGVTQDEGVGNVGDQALTGALGGALAGGVMQRGGEAISKALQPRLAPAIDTLKNAARDAYGRLDNSGVLVSADALNALGDSALDKFSPMLGLDVDPEVAANIFPKSSAVLKLLAARGTDGHLGESPASFADLDRLRRVVSAASGNAQSSDKYVARQILDHLDDFIDRLGPQHLDTTALDEARRAVNSATGQKGAMARAINNIEVNKPGALAARGAAGAGTRAQYMQLRQDLIDAEDARVAAKQLFDHESDQIATGAQSAVNDLRNARDFWKRAAKAQTLQNIVDKAKNNSTGFSQSGYENALRAGFRKLLNNDRGIARFTPDERAAIKQVATGGGSLSATNLLRQIGKLSPQGAIPLLGESALVYTHGPQALALPVAGFAGRMGATALQKGAANRAIDLAAIGQAGSAALPVSQVPASVLRLRAIAAAKSLPRLAPGAVAALSATR